MLNRYEIEDGSVIAANSVVTKDVLINKIAGGVPAKFLKVISHDS